MSETETETDDTQLPSRNNESDSETGNTGVDPSLPAGGYSLEEVAGMLISGQYAIARGASDDEPEVASQIGGEAWGSVAKINAPVGYDYPDYDIPYSDGVWKDLKQNVPQYSVNDPSHILNGMSSAELDALEIQFVRAGMISEDAILTGSRGSLMSDFTSLLLEADSNRVDWQTQLDEQIRKVDEWKKENPEEAPKTWAQLNPFVAPVYLAPDYATLAQAAKETVRGELGREVTSGEMKLLTGFLGGAHKDQWQANEYDTQFANWESTARAQESESNVMDSGTVQGVDAASRFEEMFEERYSGELQHRKNVDEVAGDQATLFGSVDNMMRMMG